MSFKRTYYSIFGKEWFIFGYIICCPFRMKGLAPYTVPLGPMQTLYELLDFFCLIFLEWNTRSRNLVFRSKKYFKLNYFWEVHIALVFETCLKLGKLQCKLNFNRNLVLLLTIDNFKTNQIVLYLQRWVYDAL